MTSEIADFVYLNVLQKGNKITQFCIESSCNFEETERKGAYNKSSKFSELNPTLTANLSVNNFHKKELLDIDLSHNPKFLLEDNYYCRVFIRKKVFV